MSEIHVGDRVRVVSDIDGGYWIGRVGDVVDIDVDLPWPYVVLLDEDDDEGREHLWTRDEIEKEES